MRRGIVAGLLGAAVVLTGALPAAAVGTPQIRSPFEGSTIDQSTPVQARVDEQCGPLSQDTASSVDVRLTVDGSAAFPGSQPAALERTRACGSDGEYSDWGGVDIDPRQPTAFFGADAAPMCNGRWRIQPRADGGTWGYGVSFLVSRVPSAPTGVSTTVDGSDVEISWARNPEPDIAGYRVERRHAGSRAWSQVSTVTTTSTVDADVADGDWEYRVVALRGDGADQPPCEDRDHDLTTASAVEAASVDTEPASPSDGGTTTDGGSTGTTSTGGGSGTDGSTSTSDGSDADAGDSGGDTTTGTDGSTDGSAAGGDDGGTSGTSGGQRRVAPPPSATRSGPDLGAPQLPSIAAPEQRYYGEDQEYSDELDFGGVDPVSGSETRSRSTTRVDTRVVPQAVQDFVNRYVDPDRVLKPIASGLVLVALALHVRRWSREQDAARR